MIKVRNLSKKFEIFKEKKRSIYAYLFGDKRPNETIWALKNVSFDLNEGEVLGVIGRNGSGKSTLLKILAGILRPTEGIVSVKGRILPFIELGIGFESELTGIENIYLYGSILGLTKKEMNQKLESVIDFANIGHFIHAKLKTYSSGMIARLAFSTALMVEPDILLIDEILSVGDEEFQKKSLEKMLEFKKNGKTIIFVSHSMEDIKQICDKCLFIDTNSKYFIGETDEIVEIYLRTIFSEKKLQVYQLIERENASKKLKECFKQMEDLLDQRILFFERHIFEKRMALKKMLNFNDEIYEPNNINFQRLQKQKKQLKSLIEKRFILIKEKKELFYKKLTKNIEVKKTLHDIIKLVHWEIKFNKDHEYIEQSLKELKALILKNKHIIISKLFLEQFKNLIKDSVKINCNPLIKLRIISCFIKIINDLKLNDKIQKYDLMSILIQKQIQLTPGQEQKQQLLEQLQSQLEERLQNTPPDDEFQNELKNVIKKQISGRISKKKKVKLLRGLRKLIEHSLKSNPKDIKLKEELKGVIGEQIEIIDNKRQKTSLLIQLQDRIKSLLRQDPSNTKLQKELIEVIRKQIEITSEENKKDRLLTQLQKMMESLLEINPDNTNLQKELIITLEEQIEIVREKDKKIRLLTKLCEMIKSQLNKQPKSIRLHKMLIDLIYEQINLTEKSENELITELKIQVRKFLKLKKTSINSSVTSFQRLLEVCPSNEKYYGIMIKLLEILNKKQCPENLVIILIRCLQIHFLNLKIEDEEKYYECLKKLLNIIKECIQKENFDDITSFVRFTVEEVIRKNNIQIYENIKNQ